MAITPGGNNELEVEITGDGSSLSQTLNEARTGLLSLKKTVGITGGALAALATGALAKRRGSLTVKIRERGPQMAGDLGMHRPRQRLRDVHSGARAVHGSQHPDRSARYIASRPQAVQR